MSSRKIRALIARADEHFDKGDFASAEYLLMRAADGSSLSPVNREDIFDRLAALACQQGLFASAAQWYLKVLHSKSERLTLADPELTETISNYRQILAFRQPDGLNVFDRVSA
jgi:hypothetical protein